MALFVQHVLVQRVLVQRVLFQRGESLSGSWVEWVFLNNPLLGEAAIYVVQGGDLDGGRGRDFLKGCRPFAGGTWRHWIELRDI
jgi:hypothetical protein